MTEPLAPTGEELIYGYAFVRERATVEDRAWLDKMIMRMMVFGHTVDGALDVLPTLTADVQHFLALADKYNVEIKVMGEEEQAMARAALAVYVEELEEPGAAGG